MTESASSTSSLAHLGRWRRAEVAAALFIVALAMGVRAPFLTQSLWNDEIGTLEIWASQPIRKIVANKDNYAPNNQVLHTLAVKTLLSLGRHLHLTRGEPPFTHTDEVFVRLPAFLAGSLIGLAIAWPLRRKHPAAALFLALIASLHPWLILFSIEARGYTMMLLFCIIATHCLPRPKRGDLISSAGADAPAPSPNSDPADPPQSALPSDEHHPAPTASPWIRRAAAYTVFATLAVYTIPLAALLVVCHGLAMLFIRRSAFLRWLAGAVAAGLFSTLLYWPMRAAMIRYFNAPYDATITFSQFSHQLPKFAVMGTAAVGWPAYAVFALLLILSIITFKLLRPLRLFILSFLLTSIASIAIASASKASSEVRFVTWLIPITAIGAGALVVMNLRRSFTLASIVGAIIIVFEVLQVAIVAHFPAEPLREAVAWVEDHRGADDAVATIYLGGPFATWAYWTADSKYDHHADAFEDWAQYNLGVRYGEHDPIPAFVPRERFLILAYEGLTDRDDNDPDLHPSHRFMPVIRRFYEKKVELPGRVAPVSVWVRREG